MSRTHRRRRPARAVLLALLLPVALSSAAVSTVVTSPSAGASPAAVYLQDDFEGPDGLLTNAYAHASQTSRTALHDGRWELTSGSLFRLRGTGYTGRPDGASPNDRSTNGTGSAVFRMRSQRTDVADATVSFSLLNSGYSTTSRTPAEAYDGVHVWLNYQSEEELYAVSVNRRDGKIAVKRKTPGGSSNGGTYHFIGREEILPSPGAVWQRWEVSSREEADGSVTIEARRDGELVISRNDTGVPLADGTVSPPLSAPGRVGLRGDNVTFRVDDLSVQSLDPVTTVPEHGMARVGVARSTVYGEPLQVTGRAWVGGDPAAGVSVRLQRRDYSSSSWVDAARGVTGTDGSVLFTPTATGKAYWRVKTSRTATVSEGVSQSGIVNVRIYAFIKTSANGVPPGTAVTLSGAVRPVMPGHQVQVQVLRSGTWRTVVSTTVGADGRYAVTVRPTADEPWRALVPRSGTLDTGTSGTLNLAVS